MRGRQVVNQRVLWVLGVGVLFLSMMGSYRRMYHPIYIFIILIALLEVEYDQKAVDQLEGGSGCPGERRPELG